MEISLGQFIRYLIFLLQQNSIALPFHREDLWHRLLYTLKESTSPGKPAFLERLHFDWDASYPKSQELSELLRALCVAKVVETTSPRFEEYKLSEEMDEFLRIRFRELDETTKRYLYFAVETARKEFLDVVSRV